MRVEYNPEEKQLTVIAGNAYEQDELEGISSVLRHGDHVELASDAEIVEVEISSATVIRRWGLSLQFNFSEAASKSAVINCIDVVYSAVSGKKQLVFLWAGEIPEDGWNTLVFGHT